MPSVYNWSLTAGENATADSGIDWTEGQRARTVNNSAREMMSRIAAYIRDNGGVAVSSGANVLTVNLSAPPDDYFAGFTFMFRAGATTSSATVTINVNGLGAMRLARNVRGSSGYAAVGTGDITVGGFYVVSYRTSVLSGLPGFILHNPELGGLGRKDTINNSDWDGVDLSIANGGTGASSAADARDNLGLTIGTNVAAHTQTLAALGNRTSGGALAANKLVYLSGAATSSMTDFTAAARTLVGASNATAQRNALELADLATTNRADLFFSGSLASQSNLPVGAIIFCLCSSSTIRNNSVNVRLDADNSFGYRVGGAGDALAGDWRSRGMIPVGSNFAAILQRIS